MVARRAHSTRCSVAARELVDSLLTRMTARDNARSHASEGVSAPSAACAAAKRAIGTRNGEHET